MQECNGALVLYSLLLILLERDVAVVVAAMPFLCFVCVVIFKI